jgi:hypothetical protein
MGDNNDARVRKHPIKRRNELTLLRFIQLLSPVLRVAKKSKQPALQFAANDATGWQAEAPFQQRSFACPPRSGKILKNGATTRFKPNLRV